MKYERTKEKCSNDGNSGKKMSKGRRTGVGEDRRESGDGGEKER